MWRSWLADFTRLMQQSEPLTDRELGLMKEVALGRFAHFSDAEIGALHGYLKARAARAPRPRVAAAAGHDGRPHKD